MSTEKRIAKYYKKKNAERRAAAEAKTAEPEVKTLVVHPVEWKRGGKTPALIVAVIFAAYLFTLWGGYVYCDSFNLTPFRTVTREWWESLLYMLSDAFVEPLSQPLVRATYATDIAFGTISSSAVFHGDNLCLHIANCMLLFVLTVKLVGLHNQQRRKIDLDPYAVGAGTALLFACHPLTSEAVAYVSARSALLVTLNYFAAILCFLRGFHAKAIKDSLLGYGFCYFFMLLAIWSGPQGLTAAASMIFLALLVKPREVTVPKWLTTRPLELFSIFLVAVVVPFVLLIKYKAPIGNGFGLEILPAAQYIATQCKTLLTYYLRVIFVPVGLSLDPPYSTASGFTDPLAIAGALVPFGIVALAWNFRRRLLIAFPLMLFVVTLLPDFLLPQPEVMSDRRMYLPLAALCIPFGVLFARALEKNHKATIAATSILILSLIGLTNWRNYAWQEEYRLWGDAYNMNKTSERSRIMRAWGLSRGKLTEAEKLALEEIKVYPNSALLHLVLGKANIAMKKYAEAKEYYKKALELADKQNLSPEVVWEMQYGMAFASLQTEDMETANEYAELALRVQPNNAVLHLIKGEYFLTQDNPQAALVELNKAHTLDRYNPEVLAPLARAAIGCGTKEFQDLGYQAATLAAKVHNSNQTPILQAYAALETGRVHEAMMYLDKYKANNKLTPEYYYLLYGVLKRLGSDKEASQAYKIATAVDPKITKKIRLYLNRPIIFPEGAPKVKLPNMDGFGRPRTAEGKPDAPHSAPPLIPKPKMAKPEIPDDAVGLPLMVPKGELAPVD